MSAITSRPTRQQLLMGITTLQELIGKAMAYHGNDRDPNGFEKGRKALEQAHELCIELRGFDPIFKGLK